jgi:hypothetical protein
MWRQLADTEKFFRKAIQRRNVELSEVNRIIFFKCLDLYRKSPNSRECQYKPNV